MCIYMYTYIDVDIDVYISLIPSEMSVDWDLQYWVEYLRDAGVVSKGKSLGRSVGLQEHRAWLHISQQSVCFYRGVPKEAMPYTDLRISHWDDCRLRPSSDPLEPLTGKRTSSPDPHGYVCVSVCFIYIYIYKIVLYIYICIYTYIEIHICM